MTTHLREMGQWLESTVLHYTGQPDPRSADWLLCFSPLVPVAIVAAYLLFVLRVGPKLMAHRKPFKLAPQIALYNAVQVLACAYISITGVREWIAQDYSFLCQPVDTADNPTNRYIANFVYGYYVIKISDLLDTVFFVLRKKYSQVSSLHVYHHSLMIFGGYCACVFSLNGHFLSVGLLNSFVHVLMYSYYLYTTLFPDKKVPLPIKKSLTALQLVQFGILSVHSALPLFQPSCQVNRLWCVFLCVQFGIMTKMFSDFYRKAYLQPKKKIR